MSTPSKLDSATLDPATLNREIAQLETDAARLAVERASLAKAVARLARWHRYLRFVRWFRSPAKTFAAYPLAVFAIGPLVIGVITLVMVNLLFNSWSLAFAGVLAGLLGGVAILATWLYYPADELLPAAIPAAEAELRVEKTRLEETHLQLTEANRRLQTLLAERQRLATSDRLQRAMLLQRDWKSMRGSEWEDFVVEVCRTLGANVQRAANTPEAGRTPSSPATGPRGVIRRTPTTLFVTLSPRRIAVAAISEIRPFHTAAVQQTINDLAGQGCDTLGIITNSRLTAGSKELARSRHCTLIGEDEFPDFVLGKVTL